ncbi:MAG: hypothetical protein JWR00_937, partial [Rubritepida sp.]|nr:hypothetical protein [Rubritepida sp.]
MPRQAAEIREVRGCAASRSAAAHHGRASGIRAADIHLRIRRIGQHDRH